MKTYTRIDAGTGREHPLSDADWPDNGMNDEAIKAHIRNRLNALQGLNGETNMAHKIQSYRLGGLPSLPLSVRQQFPRPAQELPTKQLTITCTETVTYTFKLDVPEDANDETIAVLAEKYWTEHGDPISDFSSVEDRGFDWPD